MKELSLNILDIAQNSIKAGAAHIDITITEDAETMQILVADDGCGMTEEFVANVTDPFTTTRTTRKVGLGIPFLKMQAEMTGGNFAITSRHESAHPEDHGTETMAVFYKNHIDMTPLGDIVSTISTLIFCNPDRDFHFTHTGDGKDVGLRTEDLREVLGDVPLDTPEIAEWIKGFLHEQYGD